MGFCLLLTSCSTLGLSNENENTYATGHLWGLSKKQEAARPALQEQKVPSPARQKEPATQSPPEPVMVARAVNRVDRLPLAGRYLREEERLWVEDLNRAPELAPGPKPERDPEPERPEPSITEPDADFLEAETPSWSGGEFADDMNRASLRQVITRQIDILAGTDLSQTVRLGPYEVTRQHLLDTLTAFLDLLDQDLSDEEFDQSLREEFEIIPAGYHREGRPVLFTGYYTPIIPARRQRSAEFIYPLYRKPDWYPATRVRFVSGTYDEITPVKKKILLTRAQIDGGQALSNQNLEIAWLKDKLDRYFLHIQGSGYLAFPDGSLEAVQYMGSNEFPYRSIGKQMIQDGVITPAQGSMQGIKQYFHDHPGETDAYLFRNRRYIFFNLTDGTPRGSGGVELVSGRSIATDKNRYPAGGLAFITVEKPILNDDLKIIDWQPFSRFVVDQDTGAAIKGPGRVDLYFGVGDGAGAGAGHFKQTGTMVYLLKK
ncbi:MAG: hypothetical protein GWM98_23225 [Nitrospinaceae bacterium]|nr:hypothetical protein [Nitrospinaceae bacterium]NIR56836.1 hypothetical protein [Nitrospinaceae bacterium]NIS87303.1 hypothetical protein [Nitrospinaceae bacterium]NIT84156.1 hypothetical protein [Nitrospinaceae bacterium]NIW07897.1 hypothetical protein [Nitrospinaceae bacterium]